VTSAQLNLISLSGSTTRYSAYLVALCLWHGDCDDAQEIIDRFRDKDDPEAADFLKLVADALRDGAQFQPTSCRRRLILAHDAAWLEAARRCLRKYRVEHGNTRRHKDEHGRVHRWFDALKPPTLQEWKTQFKEMYPQASLPKDSTFRRAAGELRLLYSRQTGRPLGSKDQFPRKRRGFKTRAKKLLGR
jgi:hypothetical protein